MDTVSNALCKIKNASMANLKQVEVKNNKIVKEIVRILKEEGFIDNFVEKGRKIEVSLGYTGKDRKITRITKVSNPGQRIYVRNKELKPVLNGRGIAIVSTSSGVMTGEGAKAKGLGGEYICKIW
jgi:small subunit ribosomal protein S8